MAQIVHEHLVTKGVELHLKDGVKSFQYDDKDGRTKVTLQSGTEIEGGIWLYYPLVLDLMGGN